VATSVMTAMTLTFSLTVVALQLASQQFSPRLLREFARDRLIQVVLAVLVSTFVISLTGLRGLEPDRPPPVLVVALSLVLGVVSALALLAFLGHLVRSLRVDTMMVSAHQEVCATIADSYPSTATCASSPHPTCRDRRAGRSSRRCAAASSGRSRPRRWSTSRSGTGCS
jgi:uncharacterized membrane protein